MEHKLQDGTVLKDGIIVHWIILRTMDVRNHEVNMQTTYIDLHITGDENTTPSFGSLETLQEYCKKHNIKCEEFETKLRKQ